MGARRLISPRLVHWAVALPSSRGEGRALQAPACECQWPGATATPKNEGQAPPSPNPPLQRPLHRLFGFSHPFQKPSLLGKAVLFFWNFGAFWGLHVVLAKTASPKCTWVDAPPISRPPKEAFPADHPRRCAA